MDKSAYITAFHDESAALTAAARCGTDAAIPSCPGWTIAALLGHLGGIYAAVTKYVSTDITEDIVQELEDLELSPTYEEWFRQGRSIEAMPPDVVDWFAERAAVLEAAFQAAEPSKPTWTWCKSNQTAGFWIRRMAQETAIHRWDAELAHGTPRQFDTELASDGIDEILTVYAPEQCRPQSNVTGNGESFHIHCTDCEGEWVVRFEGKGMSVSREHAKANVAFRGAASDLYLFFWHRIPADRLEVLGDAALAGRYFEFSPPD